MNVIARVVRYLKRMSVMPHKINKIQEALGRIENRQMQDFLPTLISDTEFRVYSQWGEDGIIQYLLKHVTVDHPVFVEFGVENYIESNTRFLLVNNNWSGLIIDGSKENIDYIKNDSVYSSYNLKAECSFITKDNINDLIQGNGLSGDIGMLSVDIDGNDYWVWEAITCINPRIVVCEYNSMFGPRAKVTVPYKSDFYRGSAHYTNIYYGASISALNYLATKKGYSLVGGNTAGNNVFFVRNDQLGSLQVVTPEKAYVRAQFREAQDIHGKLTFIDFNSRLREISDLDVVCVESSAYVKIGELGI